MKRVGHSIGLAASLLLSAQPIKSEPARYQCFERSSQRPVASSLVDLSNAEVNCEPTTEKPATTTTAEPTSPTETNALPEEPPVSSGPSPYAGIATDPEAVNRFVRNNPLAAKRALNLARGETTRWNGGLRVYRPGACMYTSAYQNPCLIHASPQGFEFSIPGGIPGWEETNSPPAISTRILIDVDGSSLLQLEQTGAINPSASD